MYIATITESKDSKWALGVVGCTSALQAEGSEFDPRKVHQFSTRSSMAERSLDRGLVRGSSPRGCTI